MYVYRNLRNSENHLAPLWERSVRNEPGEGMPLDQCITNHLSPLWERSVSRANRVRGHCQ